MYVYLPIGFFAGLVVGCLLTALILRRPVKAAPGEPASADAFRSLLGSAAGPAAPTEALGTEEESSARLRQNLRVKLLYQEDKIDHAIAVERERTPHASLPELLQAAIDRWERENR